MAGSLPPARAEPVPVAVPAASTDGLTPRQRFDRRRRRVNLCLLFYAISMVKLARYGLAWFG
jgi:hypothetical protein